MKRRGGVPELQMLLTDPERPYESVRRLIDDKASAESSKENSTALLIRVRESEV
jgi:hypothetical protein